MVDITNPHEVNADYWEKLLHPQTKQPMKYEYKFVFSAGLKPDLTEVNEMAKEGWELMQMGQSSSSQMTGQWYYLLRKQAPGPAEG